MIPKAENYIRHGYISIRFGAGFHALLHRRSQRAKAFNEKLRNSNSRIQLALLLSPRRLQRHPPY